MATGSKINREAHQGLNETEKNCTQFDAKFVTRKGAYPHAP